MKILMGITISLLLVLPVAASDYTLEIFGNANEDDIINMQDLTYTEQIILEYKDQTQFADAKYDDKINMQDVTQIELIILGREKEMTFLDIFGEAEMVNKPIERLAHLGWRGLEMTRVLGARDIVVCTGLPMIPKLSAFYPEISKLPNAGGWEPESIDYEMVLSLKPDAVATNLEANWAVTAGGLEKKRMFEKKLPGIPIICLNMREPDVLLKNVRTYGYIIDKEDEAEEFIDWYEGYLNEYMTRTERLSVDEKPRVYFEHGTYKSKGSADRLAQAFLLVGGRNIVDEIDPNITDIVVDPEWVIVQNPEFIFRSVGSALSGYATDDPSEMAEVRQEIMERPELYNIDAVKNGHVYTMSFWVLGGAGNTIVGAAYMGKLLHPDIFDDMDPQAIQQEYVNKFHHIDFDVREQGVFVYPALEES